MTYKQGDCIYILKPALVLSVHGDEVLVATGSETPFKEKAINIMPMNNAPATVIGVLNGKEGYKGDSQSQNG